MYSTSFRSRVQHYIIVLSFFFFFVFILFFVFFSPRPVRSHDDEHKQYNIVRDASILRQPIAVESCARHFFSLHIWTVRRPETAPRRHVNQVSGAHPNANNNRYYTVYAVYLYIMHV